MKYRKYICVLLIASALCISGCLPMANLQNNQGAENHYLQMNKNDFAKEIQKLNSIIRSGQATKKETAEAHRQLAIIYLIPRNPKKSDKKAVNELGKYLEMTPGGLNRKEAASWATAIRSAKEYNELERKVARIGKENRQLQAQNAKLKDDIEKLKNLDLSLEKKKKSLR